MIIPTFVASFAVSMLVFFISLLGDNIEWAFFSMLIAFVISIFIIGLFGIPLVLILKKYNKLNYRYVLTDGFFINFCITLSSWFVNPQFNSQSGKQLIAAIGVGMIGLIASSIFYKTYLIRKKQKPHS